MEQTVSIKVKLLAGQQPNFDTLTNRFTEVCNYISVWIFNHDFELNQSEINKRIYYDIRKRFNFKSQLTQSAIRCVVLLANIKPLKRS